MNKLSILIVLSLVAFVASYHYDFTIGLSDQSFSNVTGLARLVVKNSHNPQNTYVARWKSDLVPNTNQTAKTIIVPFLVEELVRFYFKWTDVKDPQSRQSIILKDFYLAPIYFRDPDLIAEKTIRLCPDTPHQVIYANSMVELSAINCDH